MWSEYASVMAEMGFTQEMKMQQALSAATLSIDGDSADVFNGFTTVGEAGA